MSATLPRGFSAAFRRFASLPALDVDALPEHGHFVYFVRCHAFVRVGVTGSLRSRILSHVAASPFPVRLIGYGPGDVACEAAIHDRILDTHHHSEWFFVSDTLLEIVCTANFIPSTWAEMVGDGRRSRSGNRLKTRLRLARKAGAL